MRRLHCNQTREREMSICALTITSHLTLNSTFTTHRLAASGPSNHRQLKHRHELAP